MNLEDLVRIFQLAIGPTILVSGIGMVLLSMTTRYSRIIDRTRVLSHELNAAAEGDRDRILAQMRILARRMRIVRTALALAASAVLMAALLIIGLFLGALLSLSITAILITAFTLCLLCLIGALVQFIRDVNLSLAAVWLELPAEVRESARR